MQKQTQIIIISIIIIAIIIVLGIKFSMGYYNTILPEQYRGTQLLNETIENTEQSS